MKCSTSPKIKKFGCDLDDDEKYQKMKAVEEKKAEVAKDCKGKKRRNLPNDQKERNKKQRKELPKPANENIYIFDETKQ